MNETQEMHAPHKCFNCGLTIESHEDEVRVDTKQVIAKKKAARMNLRSGDYSPIRYRHATYEACTEAEQRAAERYLR